MEIEEAAGNLAQALLSSGNPCIKGVGVQELSGNKVITVYVDKGDYTQIPLDYESFPVNIQYIGNVTIQPTE